MATHACGPVPKRASRTPNRMAHQPCVLNAQRQQPASLAGLTWSCPGWTHAPALPTPGERDQKRSPGLGAWRPQAPGVRGRKPHPQRCCSRASRESGRPCWRAWAPGIPAAVRTLRCCRWRQVRSSSPPCWQAWAPGSLAARRRPRRPRRPRLAAPHPAATPAAAPSPPSRWTGTPAQRGQVGAGPQKKKGYNISQVAESTTCMKWSCLRLCYTPA